MIATQMIAQMGHLLPCWWYAWRSGGTSRRLLLLQAGYLVWYLVKGGRRRT